MKSEITAEVINEIDISSIDLICEDECSILHLSVDRMEMTGYWNLFTMNFYTSQRPFWDNLRTNLKMIWSIVRGRRYLLYAIIISKEKMEEFKKFVADI